MSHSLAMEPMDVERFMAFTSTRPDDEKWELVDGEAILNASPSYLHQLIVANLIMQLGRACAPVWQVIPGMTIPIADRSAPVPDVLVRPKRVAAGNLCDDAVVAIEVLSPSTARRDLVWKRSAYAAAPTLERYVIVAQDDIRVHAFARRAEWREVSYDSAAATLPLPEVGAILAIAEIYENTGLV